MDLTKYGVNKNSPLLKKALTHSSYSNENNVESYERLEFLGDSVLGLVLSDYFFKNTNYTEGEMSKIRASYVCEAALYAYAKDLGIIKHIKLGHGLEDQENIPIIADVFESIVATIYLEAGYKNAEKFVLAASLPYIKNNIRFLMDYKSHFQELIQTEKNQITYNVLKEEGPSHDRTYHVEVLVNDIVFGTGRGRSKKEAEQNAAKDAINKKAGE